MAPPREVDSNADTGAPGSPATSTQVGRPDPAPPSGDDDTVLPNEAPQPQLATPVTVRQLVDHTKRAGDLETLPPVDPQLYTVGIEIGRGGMGRILAARDRRLRRDVVIKVLRDGMASVRFEREALITARLQHPSIVRVYDAGNLDGEAFYAMEHVRGQSLDRVVAQTDDPQARLALLPHVIAIADALAYAHSEGVIHRDLKPANVLVGSFGETVVIDWGLAKDLREPNDSIDPIRPPKPVGALGALESVASPVTGGLTMAGAVMGTPAYMPPEQARGEPADERSDVYAIGAILYHVLAGMPPVSGERALEDARAGGIPPLQDRAADAPPELVTIALHAMAYNAADRYATARELADDLRRFAAGKLVARHSYSIGALIRRWVRRYRAAVGVGVAALTILGVFSVFGIRGLANERDRAQHEATVANEALHELEAETDDIAIHQAERALPTDPTQVIAWLQRLSPAGLERPRARELADAAAKRGIAFELVGPKDDIEHVVTVDAKTAYTASNDGHLWRWQLAAWRGRDLGAHTGPVNALTASSDGFWLATAGTDHSVRVWDLFKGENRALQGHASAVRGVAFSPDGNTLASAGDDGTLRLWVIATSMGRVATTDPHPLGPIAWSKDGGRLWTGTNDGRVLEIDAASAKLVAVALRPHTAELRVLALSPDGTQLASGGDDGVAYVWAIADHKKKQIATHGPIVRDLAWAPDGKRIATAGGDPFVRVYDVASGTSTVLSGSTAGVKDVAISADGEWVAAAGLDGKARVWPISGGEPRTFAGHRGAVKAVTFTPDGAMLVTTSDDDRVRLWPLAAPPPTPVGAALGSWLIARTNTVVAVP